jgi:hypothetical protein
MHTDIKEPFLSKVFKCCSLPTPGIPWAVLGETCSSRKVFRALTRCYGRLVRRRGGAPMASAVWSVTASRWRGCLDRSDSS